MPVPDVSKPPLRFEAGIEGTFEPVSGRDTLSITGHFERGRWWTDLARVRELGVSQLRYPVPWHRIEKREGHFDWREVDRILHSATRDHGLEIIADPLHHTSYPKWLKHGFMDERFKPAYLRFLRSLMDRHPQIRVFTPFNEPTCTLDFCGLRGIWHPYGRDDRSMIAMLRNTARAVAEAIQAIRSVRADAYILQVDTFQHHAWLDENSRLRAEFLNERRFLFDELVLGRVNPSHSLHAYLLGTAIPRKSWSGIGHIRAILTSEAATIIL